ncbi:hypothetical protein LCGC14_1112560 [marine sediment metagenome]|uniref:Uncharacterized protein n=1 Tax=marine sediment metagenome TaxID=412755 RepID=A0A0F9MB33_9ZZZZ
MKNIDLVAWKKKIKSELLLISIPVRQKRQKQQKAEPKPFKWRATASVCSQLRVTRERAEKLASIGEYVDPNPFCNWKKWGLEDPTLVSK